MVNKYDIGIYRLEFPLCSETFISEQARHMRKYCPFFIVTTKKGPIEIPYVALSDHDFYQIRYRLMISTKIPSFFIRNSNLSNLKLIHAHFGPDAVYALALSDALRIPLITTFHGYDITINESCYSGVVLKHYLRGRKKLMDQGAAFIAVSKFIQNKLDEKGFPTNKIIQHYIGVDVEKFSPVKIKNNDRYILSVGRHTQKKGIDTLLRAFQKIAHKHKDVSLIQVGDGPMSRELQALVVTYKLEKRVKFIGSQPHHKVLSLMQNAEIFALPSQTAINGDSEALGIVFNEASACAIPVVSTMHGGIPEAVLHKETGILSPEKDERSLADNIDVLLSDKGLCADMGRRGREYVCDVFDIRKQMVKLERIYDKFIETR